MGSILCTNIKDKGYNGSGIAIIRYLHRKALGHFQHLGSKNLDILSGIQYSCINKSSCLVFSWVLSALPVKLSMPGCLPLIAAILIEKFQESVKLTCPENQCHIMRRLENWKHKPLPATGYIYITCITTFAAQVLLTETQTAEEIVSFFSFRTVNVFFLL